MNTIDKIKQILNSDFQRDLFNSALENLADESNKLRYNNFAYSIRELSRHFLYSLAPEDKLTKCLWYKVVTEDGKPARSQRIKYAIQGGLSDELLLEKGFDLTELKQIIKETKDEISFLSKHTHINEDNFNLNEEQIKKNSQQVLETFAQFVDTILNYREDLKNELDTFIEQNVLEQIIFSTLDEIDILASHHTIDYSEVEDYEIIDITNDKIIVSVEGIIHVTLEYGSKIERRNDDGLDINESFPYSCTILYEIGDTFPSNNYEIKDLIADTQSWYGDEEDNDY